ncbi:ROK family protein [Desulfurispira natronophila]|uniref:Glucokinase n=1 Tax=Desulfurispira natronophila TaxID=682562 RepID=A0A7W8DGV8_9BACT|nr:ROK family protein [Desulfurispira natronophila]MBB5021752.1 glucokinase [Desulfurispira natronophila]
MFAGVDIGATTTKIAVETGSGLRYCKVSTDYASLSVLCKQHTLGVEKIACAVPAPVARNTIQSAAPNLTTLPAIPPGVPLLNDGNAAALGEFHERCLDRNHSLFMLSVGTGLGGGYIYNGQVMEGASGFFAEIGHFSFAPDGFACGCGARGCSEQYASSRFLCCYGVGEEGLYASAHSQVRKEIVSHLARVINSVINLYDPHLIVIGGGLGLAMERCLSDIVSQIKPMAFHHRPLPPIEISRLGEYAAAHGLIHYARQQSIL